MTGRTRPGFRPAGVVAGLVTVGAVLLLPGSSAATPRGQDAPRPAVRPAQPDPAAAPVRLCVDAHLDVLGLIVVDLGVAVQVGSGPGCAPAPTTTTTTTPPPPPTATTTAPPPPAVTTTLPPTTTTTAPPQIVAPTTTTSTSTTSSTTTTLPPPPAPDLPPPRLALRVGLSPEPPAAGEPATATIEILNEGGAAISDVTLVNDVSPAADVRSATTPGGSCATTARQATCGLGTIPAGGHTTADVRLMVDEQPASRTIIQRISLSTGSTVEAGGTTASDLLAAEESGPSLLSLPGPTVTLVAFVGFVMAARSTR